MARRSSLSLRTPVSLTLRPTTLGWFTGTQSPRGLTGTRSRNLVWCPYLSFGVGFGIGFFGGFGWGWGHWGCNWQNGYTIYNNNRYYSRSTTFYNRNNYYRGGGERGVETNVQRGLTGNRGGGEHGEAFNRPGPATHSYSGNTQAARGGESGNRGGYAEHSGGA